MPGLAGILFLSGSIVTFETYDVVCLSKTIDGRLNPEA
jgi:hypothetical protein